MSDYGVYRCRTYDNELHRINTSYWIRGERREMTSTLNRCKGSVNIYKIMSTSFSSYWSVSTYKLFVALPWRHNGLDSFSNHQPHHCLLNRLFGRRSKKTSKLRVTGLCVGTHRGPVNYPHKWPVTRKMFPFDDVIMVNSCSLVCTPGLLRWHSCGHFNALWLSAHIRVNKQGSFGDKPILACFFIGPVAFGTYFSKILSRFLNFHCI